MTIPQSQSRTEPVLGEIETRADAPGHVRVGPAHLVTR